MPGDDCLREHNTVVEVESPGWRLVWYAEPPTAATATFRNNVFVVGEFQGIFGDPGAVTDHNLAFSTTGATLADVPASDTDVTENPAFVNLAARDFRLAEGSPAIDAGADLGYEPDFEHRPRLAGKQPDLGAYEHGSAPALGGAGTSGQGGAGTGATPAGGNPAATGGAPGGANAAAGTGGSHQASSAGSGATAASSDVDDDGGCGCRASRAWRGSTGMAALLALVALLRGRSRAQPVPRDVEVPVLAGASERAEMTPKPHASSPVGQLSASAAPWCG